MKEIISKFGYDWKYFGIKISLLNLFSTIGRKIFTVPNRLLEKIETRKHQSILSFLSQQFAPLIQKYQKEKPKKSEGKYEKTIRCCWRQGEQGAPDIVKKCIQSIKQYKGEYQVILLDQNNLSQYLQIPDFIMKKVENKDISLTHLSDIIRIGILKQYGGIWVDATMFFTKDIFSQFDHLDFNSNYPENHIKKHYEFTKWTGFFMGGSKENILFSFVYDFFLQYHQRYQKIIDFFLIDYALYLAYLHVESCKNTIDQITLKNEEIFHLVQIFNDPYNEQLYHQIIKEGFFKLTYKISFNKYTKQNQLTNYGKFLEDF